MGVSRRQIIVIAAIVSLYALVSWQPLSHSLGGWLQIMPASFIHTLPCSAGALICFLGYKLDRPIGFLCRGGGHFYDVLYGT